MTDFFVKPGGIDTLDGLSDATAWGTTAKPNATTFLPGARVQLKCGSLFPGNLFARGNGLAGNPIVYTSYATGIRPIVSAADIPLGWTLDATVAGGQRYRKAALGWTPEELWREDGAIGAGTVRNLQKRTTLATCTALHDWFYSGADLYVVLAAGETPNVGALTLHVGKRTVGIGTWIGNEQFIRLEQLIGRFANDAYACIQATTNSVQNNGWEYIDVVAEWGGVGIKLGGQGTNSFAQPRVVTMRRTACRNNRTHGAAIIFATDGSLIEDGDFSRNGNQGIGLAMRHGIFRRNLVELNAGVLGLWTTPATVPGFSHGLYLVGQVPNSDRSGFNLITENVFRKNGKAGYATDALSSDNTFFRNESTENVLFGVMLEGGTANSSARNRLINETYWGNRKSGVHVINAHGPFTMLNCQVGYNGKDGNAQDVYVEFSLFFGAGGGVQHSGSIWKHLHVDWDPVALCQDNRTLLTRVTGIPTAPGQWSWDAASETVYVWKTDGTPPQACWVEPAFVMDYNNYTPAADFPPGHALLRLVTATKLKTYTTLAQLQADGLELHGRQENPRYVNPAAGDFRLQADSPSIGSGVLVPGLTQDHPDIGAHQSMPNPTDPPIDAGSYLVTAAVNDPNHEGQATGTLVISKSEAEVSLSGLAQTYDGQPHAVTVTTDPPGLPVVVTYQAA